MVDGGYDVADYRDIDPLFGTLADAEALIDEAHDLGLRVLLDLVPNHTSDRHPWFEAALAAGAGLAGTGPLHLPRRAWSRTVPSHRPTGERLRRSAPGRGRPTRTAPGQWYLHLFAPEQPDLDWSDPAVGDEFERCCGSGSTAAPTASGSMSRMAS